MFVTTQEFLDRAKGLVDADEVAVRAWIPDTLWLHWLNREVRRGYRALLRAGVVTPDVSSQLLTSTTTEMTEYPLAIAGVYEISTTPVRWLRPAQPTGAVPSETLGTAETGTSTRWSVTFPYAFLPMITLRPVDSTGRYYVQYVKEPVQLTLDTPEGDGLNLPAGLDERIVLGVAESAFTRDGASPPSITRGIQRWDAELDLLAQQQLMNDPPRIKNVDNKHRGWALRGQDRDIAGNPSLRDWWWAP